MYSSQCHAGISIPHNTGKLWFQLRWRQLLGYCNKEKHVQRNLLLIILVELTHPWQPELALPSFPLTQCIYMILGCFEVIGLQFGWCTEFLLYFMYSGIFLAEHCGTPTRSPWYSGTWQIPMISLLASQDCSVFWKPVPFAKCCQPTRGKLLLFGILAVTLRPLHLCFVIRQQYGFGSGSKPLPNQCQG